MKVGHTEGSGNTLSGDREDSGDGPTNQCGGRRRKKEERRVGGGRGVPI